jgi:hypothetical protein
LTDEWEKGTWPVAGSKKRNTDPKFVGTDEMKRLMREVEKPALI